MLLSSHQLSEVQQVCDRVAIMSRGQVIAAGTVAELLAGGSSGDLRVRVPDPAAARQLLEQAGSPVSPLGDAWRVGGVTDPGQLTRLLSQAGLLLTELSPIAPTWKASSSTSPSGQPSTGRPPGPPDPDAGDRPRCCRSTRSAATGRQRAPTFGRLLGAEFRRLAYRRFVRVVALLAVLGFIAAVFAIYRPARDGPVPADLAAASRSPGRPDRRDPAGDPGMPQSLPAGSDPRQCGPPPTAEDFPLDEFLHRQPLEPAQISDYALAIGVAVAMLGFAIGASFIGAEWSSKNLICLAVLGTAPAPADGRQTAGAAVGDAGRRACWPS